MEIGNHVKINCKAHPTHGLLGVIFETYKKDRPVGKLDYGVTLKDGRTFYYCEKELEVVPVQPEPKFKINELVNVSTPLAIYKERIGQVIGYDGSKIRVKFDDQLGCTTASFSPDILEPAEPVVDKSATSHNTPCPRAFYEKLNSLKTAEREQFLKSTVLDALFKHNDIIAIHALMNLAGLKNGG